MVAATARNSATCGQISITAVRSTAPVLRMMT